MTMEPKRYRIKHYGLFGEPIATDGLTAAEAVQMLADMTKDRRPILGVELLPTQAEQDAARIAELEAEVASLRAEKIAAEIHNGGESL